MHSKYQRRLSHAEHTQLRKRDATQIIENSQSSTGGFILTAPTTITVVQTVPETASSSASSTASTIISNETTPTSSTEQPTKSSAATSSLQTPPATLAFSSGTSSSIIPPTTTSLITPDSSSSTPIAVGSLSSSNELPGGAIAAIVIAVLIAFVGTTFFLIRSKSRRNRMRLRPLWTQSKAIKPAGISSANYQFQPFDDSDTLNPATETRQVPSRVSRISIIRPAANVSVPSSSYNNDNSIAIKNGLATENLPPTRAVYSTGMKSPSAFGAVVLSSFITRLPDELSINVGEKLRILAEYDDGWSLCMNNTGEQGMVPNECLSGGGAGSPEQSSLVLVPTQSAERRSSRANSLGRS